MYKNQMVYGLSNITQSKDIYKECLMSKQTRKIFPQKSGYSSTQVLQLVHSDLCGLIEPVTSRGNRYSFLLVDDFSRLMWVYMIKIKDEAFGVFKKFRALVEDGKEKKIRVLKTNRGRLWGEAVRHSVYVLNRLPTRALSNQTPYEACTGLKPNLSHI